mgnify:CR=1 FL=1
MSIKLKSEKRIKQVVTSGGGSENANTYEAGDLVYSTSDDTLKQSDATNWKDVPIHPITKLYITANGESHYVFNGPGFDATANSNTGDRNPTIYLVRGQKYQFENLIGNHGFRISSSDGGGAYTDGITNNDVTNGILEWNVMHDVPNTMYYYCLAGHSGMKGEFKIVDAGGGGGATNLSIGTHDATTLEIVSSTGNNVTIPQAGGSNKSGLMSDGDFDKLAAYPVFGSFNFTSVADTPAAYAGSNADANKFVKVNGSGDGIIFQNVDISPGLMFHAVTISGSNVNIESNLNAGDGGTVTVADTSQNAGGTASGKGVTVDTANLTKEAKKARYEIMSASPGNGFRFKAENTAIVSFGGQTTIAANVGDNNGLSVGDSQKVVLLYNGSNWVYMVQSI